MATVTGSVAGGDWNQNATWLLGAQPTANDDVVLIVTSGPINIPAGVTAVCKSLDCTGFTSSLTFAATSSVLTIGNATGGLCKFVSGMTLPLTGIGTINFVASQASTTFALTTAGLTMPNLTVNVGSTTTIQFADNVTATGATLTLTAGKLDTNSKTVTAGAFASSGSTARTITLGSSAITLTSNSSTWSVGTVTSLTVTANTATATLTAGTGTNFISGAVNWNGLSVSITGAGTQTITAQGAFTVANLTRTGTAVKTDGLSITGPFTVTSTLTLGGNSTQGVNRLFVQSNTVGTSRTITCAAVVISGDVDFMDITITYSGGASWTNAGSAYIGHAQGNGGAVTTNVTTPATQTATGTASFTWSTHGWTSRVPLPQDNVVISNVFVSGRIVTADMPRLGANITWAGATWAGTAPAWSNSVTQSMFGNLTLVSGMTVSGTNRLTLANRAVSTFTSAGVPFTQGVTVSAPSGTYTLQDALTISNSATSALSVAAGTLNDGGFTVSISGIAGSFTMSSGTLIKTGNWTFGMTTAASFVSVSGGTVTDSGSWTLTTASANTRTFAGGGKTYGTLTYTVAGSTGTLIITGSNAFGQINFSDASNARTLQFTSGTTNTITNPNIFGTSGKKMTVSAVTGGVAAILIGPDWRIGANSNLVSGTSGLSVAAGTTAMDYLTAQDITGDIVAVRALTESAGATDTIARVVAFSRPLTEVAGATDSLTRALRESRTLADVAGATDVVATAGRESRSISDVAGATDTITRLDILARVLLEVAGATDSISPHPQRIGPIYSGVSSPTERKGETDTTSLAGVTSPRAG